MLTRAIRRLDDLARRVSLTGDIPHEVAAEARQILAEARGAGFTDAKIVEADDASGVLEELGLAAQCSFCGTFYLLDGDPLVGQYHAQARCFSIAE